MTQERWQRIMGALRLGCDAVAGTSEMVRRNHALVANQVFDALDPIGSSSHPVRSVRTLHDGIASTVYDSIGGINSSVSMIIDHAADAGTAAVALGVAGQPGAAPDTAHALPEDNAGLLAGVLNGLYGDYLDSQNNALATPMTVRAGGRILPLERGALLRTMPAASPRICLFIHGLACTESVWQPRSADDAQLDFGEALAADLGYTPLYLRYNSGLHISTNGRYLAELLGDLLAAYPVPVEELVLVGHSMGGLVARSAIHHGDQVNAGWLQPLSMLICLGTPNLGAPLERSTSVVSKLLRRIKTPGTQIPADLLELRSAGIQDLRFGYLHDEEWQQIEPDTPLRNYRRATPLPPGVAGYAIASTVTQEPHHPLGALIGDLLVRPDSATGRTQGVDEAVNFTATADVGRLHHFHLTSHPEIYRRLRQVFDGEPRNPAP